MLFTHSMQSQTRENRREKPDLSPVSSYSAWHGVRWERKLRCLTLLLNLTLLTSPHAAGRMKMTRDESGEIQSCSLGGDSGGEEGGNVKVVPFLFKSGGGGAGERWAFSCSSKKRKFSSLLSLKQKSLPPTPLLLDLPDCQLATLEEGWGLEEVLCNVHKFISSLLCHAALHSWDPVSERGCSICVTAAERTRTGYPQKEKQQVHFLICVH